MRRLNLWLKARVWSWLGLDVRLTTLADSIADVDRAMFETNQQGKALAVRVAKLEQPPAVKAAAKTTPTDFYASPHMGSM